MIGEIETPRPVEAYAQQLRQLLPRGSAWAAPAGGNFDGLLLGLAAEFARIDSRSLDLVDEADPRTALELLPDWERVAGLPDACTGIPDSIFERQRALHQKIAGVGGQNAAAFVALALLLGYVIEIEEHAAFVAGMPVGGPVNGQAWAFAWTVHIRPYDGVFAESEFLAFLRAGDPCGRRLVGYGALDIECVIRRAAPAHTFVIFAYQIDPTPAFWMDFT